MLRFFTKLVCVLVLISAYTLHAEMRINEICAVASDRLIRWDENGRARIGAGVNWHDNDFDSSSWSSGTGPVGMGEDVETDVTAQMQMNTPSLYLRKTFTATAGQAAGAGALTFDVEYTDGFAAYLNGVEIARGNTGAGGAPLFHDQVAFNGVSFAVSGFSNRIWTDSITIGAASSLLREGTNVFAIQLHNNDPSLLDTTLFCNPSLKTAADELLMGFGGTWSWFVGMQEPSGGIAESVPVTTNPLLEWVQPNFNDDDWLSGPGGIGYGDGDDATDVQELIQNITSTLYMRRLFEVTDTGGTLEISVDYDDGFVAYINGKEIARRNAGAAGSFVPHSSTSTETHEAGTPEIITMGATSEFLETGTNILAIQVLNFTLSSSDLTMNFDLYAQGGSPFVSQGDTWKYFPGTEEPVPLPADDPDSGFLDWIELKNDGTQPVSLDGWSVTDDAGNPDKWIFPDITLPAGGLLVVACSDKNIRDPAAPILHTGFNLSQSGEYVGLYNGAGTMVSEIAPGYPAQHPFFTYGWDEATNAFRYFRFPTPGKENDTNTFSTLPDPPQISADSGFYEGSLDVVISTPLAEASIRYTTDGSAPTADNGIVYTGMISVSGNTALRAATITSEGIVSEPASRTFIMNAPSALKTLPAVCLIGDEGRSLFKAHGVTAICGGSWVTNWRPLTPDDYNTLVMHGRPYERRICFELFQANTNTWAQADAGIRTAGSGWSRPKYILQDLDGLWTDGPEIDKAQFNVNFRGIYGSDRLTTGLIPDSPLKSFQKLRIRSGKGDWRNPFIQDEVMRCLYGKMGQMSSVGFLGGFWVNGVFRNFYNPVERLGEAFYQDRFGSTLGWDALSHNMDAVLSYTYSANDGDDIAWLEMFSFIDNNNTSVLSNYVQLTQRIDPENFADYMLINMYGATQDWPWNNWHVSRERSINGRFRFHVWDAEFTFGLAVDNPYHACEIDHNTITSQLQSDYHIPQIYRALAASDEFKIMMQDRIAEHFFNGGCLEDAAILAEYNLLADALDPMMQYVYGESVTRSQANYWISGRRPYFLQQMRNEGFWNDLVRPEISPAGSNFNGQVTVSISCTNDGGTVYYALDGDDPREPGSGSIQGLAYTGPFELTRSSRITARVLDDGVWGPRIEAVFMKEDPTLLLTEVHYNPEDPPDGSSYDNDDFEFVEFKNISQETINLNAYELDGGVEFLFEGGGVTLLEPGEYVVVVRNREAFASRYDTNAMHLAGEYDGKLSNSGENVRMEFYGRKLFDIAYNDARGWPPAADGGGPSLIPLNERIETQGFDILDCPINWRASTYIGGSPGMADPEPSGTLVINEVIAHTDTGEPAPFDSNDQIELFNPTAETIILDGNWYLSDSLSSPEKWNIPDGTIIPAGDWVVFDEDDFHPLRTDGFGLDKAGELVVLSHRPGADTNRVIDCVKFKGQANGASWGRYPDGDVFFQPLEPTAGGANQLPNPGIWIQELMYNPLSIPGTNADEVLEYILLTNGSAQTVNFTGESITNTWRIDSGVDYSFASGTSMAVGERLWIVPFDPVAEPDKKTLFCTTYGLNPASIRLMGPYSGDLSDSGERIALERPQASDDPLTPDDISWIIVDEVTWLDEAPWPMDVDGSGLPLLRIGASGNDPQSWASPSDSDNDGLPDVWEQTYRSNLSDLGAGDFDGDGHSDTEEYIAGTNPTDETSFLEIAFEPLIDHEHLIHWTPVSGRVYNVYWTSNLLSPFVSISEDLIYPQGSYTDQTHQTLNSGFYSIKAQYPDIPAE